MPGTRSLRSKVIGPSRPVGSGPPSPTMSESTNISAMHFGAGGPEKIITRANLKASIASYEKLISSSANYRAALLQLSRATASFADAMQMCSSLKGPSYEAGTRLQAASGLHHLMSNHWHIIAETCDREFEKPLRQHLGEYKATVAERSSSYEKTLEEKTALIRKTEVSNLNKKGRNLQSFREALAILQKQVDELDEIKGKHYQSIIEHEEGVWNTVQSKTSVIVRSTMDVFDRLTSKASDPVIEHMLQAVPDPFDAYGPAPATEIFTILPPLSIIAQPGPQVSASPSQRSSATSEMEGSDSAPNSTTAPFAGASGSQSSPWMFGGTISGNGGYFASSADPVAAWASTAGTTPLPASPSTSPPERSPSPSDGHVGATRPRRSGSSGLRNVLSAIDESSASGDTSSNGGTVRANSSPAALEGGADDAGGWLSSEYAYGQTPYRSVVQDVAPRHSVLFAPAGAHHAIDETPRAAAADFFDTPEVELARPTSPLSSDTAVPVPT